MGERQWSLFHFTQRCLDSDAQNLSDTIHFTFQSDRSNTFKSKRNEQINEEIETKNSYL